MSRPRFLLFLGVGLALSLGLLAGAPAQNTAKKNSLRPSHEVIQEFPSNDLMRTAWKVNWATAKGFGLYIQDAWFKKSPKEPWIQILGDARVSELFVPYHQGTPRFWDISIGFDMVTLTRDDAGPFGKLLGNPPQVVQELRDRGITWMDGTKGSRRGQKLVLWGAILAANYRYISEYSFCDDGTINFRVGSSGRNYGSREWDGHMHNAMWRVDVNLDGPNHNSVYVMEHEEPDPLQRLKAKTVHRPFNGGREGFEDWDSNKFTMLNITADKKKNIRNMPWSYDVVPWRMGNARHYGDKEECTHHDFWVTRQRPGEIYYQKVPDYVKNGEPIMNTDVVLWHSTPCHHEPRSEDGEMKGNDFHGVTQVIWSGFDLRPRNFFDRSPLYP